MAYGIIAHAQETTLKEESKKSKELNGQDVEFHRAKKKIISRDSFSSGNSGVQAHALKGQACPLVFRKVRPPTRTLKTTYRATRPNLIL